MKNIFKSITLICIVAGTTGCGNGFLDTDYYEGIDAENGLSSVDNIEVALNGTYQRFLNYNFAGNYALDIADIASDLGYWNAKYSHFASIVRYIYDETDSNLEGIWNYGYKVVDNASRVILGAKNIYESCTDSDKALLNRYIAESYALRGFSQLLLVNVFAHQVKVNGQDYSSQPGIVLVDEPIEAYTQVSRSTIGECYDAVISDLQNALTYFDAAGGDRGDLFFIGRAACYGLLARASLYLENWSSAASYAQKALDEAGITTLTYGYDEYRSLYDTATSNSESFFALAVTTTNNNGSESLGNYWSVYGFSPTVKLQNMYGENDIRLSVFTWSDTSTPSVPTFGGGKYAHFSTGNPYYGTSYLVNAPEMFLIIAESDFRQGSLDDAKEALLTVARRDPAVTSVSDLPSSSDEFLTFLKDERCRELFQEGFRLWDLRRWDEISEVYAYGAPENKFTYTNYRVSGLLFPIPSDEVTSGFGVEQNENWSATRPQ